MEHECHLVDSPALRQGARPPSVVIRGPERLNCRSIWISDFHLGTRRCRAEALLDFLRHHQAEILYLVGDIVDGWNFGPSWYWSPAQAAVVAEIVEWRRCGARIEFIVGNHDECNLDLVESLFGILPSRSELIHRTVEGRRMLVTHGHQFDRSVSSGRWLKGSQAYRMALRINEWYESEQARHLQRRRSISAYLRYRVQKAVQYLTDFDDREVFRFVRRHRADGVICGHTHRPEQRLIGPLWYINDGDWVESRTALIESFDGALRLLRWAGQEQSEDPELAASEETL